MIIKTLPHQSVCWFKQSNTYVLLQHATAQLLQKMSEGLPAQALMDWSVHELEIAEAEAQLLLVQLVQLIETLNRKSHKPLVKPKYCGETDWFSIKNYKIHEHRIQVRYASEYLEYQLHPKFSHLECWGEHFDSLLEVQQQDQWLTLQQNGIIRGQYTTDELAYFQGKFAMVLLESFTKTAETDYLGVLHATAVHNHQHALLFYGASGQGKSTLAALLCAHGFHLLADDFVPLTSESNRACYFPAALSIKEKAIPAVLPYFPELAGQSQYNYPRLGKKVCYLPVTDPDWKPISLPCKALVAVHYQEGTAETLQALTTEEVLQQLIPDAWIASDPRSAAQFLNWVAELPAYRLTYHSLSFLLDSATKLFNDEL